MADDYPKYVWPTYQEFMILDGGLDHRSNVDECPKCYALVREMSRERHEAVCWVD